MTGVVRVHATGGPERLVWEQAQLGAPGPGALRLRHTAIGLNYIDTYHRTGLYPLETPFVPGIEAAAVVEAVGPGVSGFSEGDRVAYMLGPAGAYSQHRLIAADFVVPLPDTITDETAAAMMLKGCTVEYLIHRTFAVQRGQSVLWHAAAGGVGLIACQWLAALGVRVIGTAGSPEKAEAAHAHGCADVILYREEDVADRVRELTGGAGVPVVFDGVGRTTFAASLDSLAPRGLFVSFGNASGPVAPFAPAILSQKGSLFFTRPTLAHYYSNRDEIAAGTGRLFDMVASGRIRIEIHHRYALKDAAQAHRDLEARATTGSSILLPDGG